MEILESPRPAPAYLTGTAGEATIATLKQLLHDLTAHPNPHGNDWHERRRIVYATSCLGRWKTRFAGGWAQGNGFDRLMTNAAVIGLAVVEPNFKDFYWSPEKRGQIASLVIMFVRDERVVAVRLVSVHTDGRVVGVHDFGEADFAFMTNNVKYRNLGDALRQHVGDLTYLLPKHA